MILRLILHLHTLVLAGQRAYKPESDDAAKAAKRMTLMATVVPVAVSLIALVFLLKPMMDELAALIVLHVVALLCVFGFGWYTDRVFDRHRSMIEEWAAEIRNDPTKGANRALLRYLGLLLAAFTIAALLCVAVRWSLIQSGQVEGPLIQI